MAFDQSPPAFGQVRIGCYSNELQGQWIMEAVIGESGTLKPDNLTRTSLRNLNNQLISLPSLEPRSHSLSRERGKRSGTLVWQLRPTWLLSTFSLFSKFHPVHRAVGNCLHVPCGFLPLPLPMLSPPLRMLSWSEFFQKQTLRQDSSARSIFGKRYQEVLIAGWMSETGKEANKTRGYQASHHCG